MDPHGQQRTDSVQAPSETSGTFEKETSPDINSIPSMHEPFRSMDNPAVLEESMQLLSLPTSRNFVLEFGDSHSHVAFDLGPSNIQALLKSDRPEASSTRWINLWYPFHQRSVLDILGQHYDFSPRLLALMSADPKRPPRSNQSSPYSAAVDHEYSISDLESGSPTPSPTVAHGSVDQASLLSNSAVWAGNLYDIVNEVWHYSSIDQGRSYLCLGFNSLYSIGNLVADSGVREQTSEREQANRVLPCVKRVWTWLVLLADRTVLTITEDLFPYSNGYLSAAERQIILQTRRNLTNVFRSLSNVEMDYRERSPLTLLPIRRRLGTTPEETAHRSSDAPGLLFYYLFENWQNSYSLVTRKESRYGMELQQVRKEMFQAPKLAHIDRLDQIGSQLMVLARHYRCYLRLIDRIVQPQEASLVSLANSRVASKASKESFDTPGYAVRPPHGTIFTLGARNAQPTADVAAAEQPDELRMATAVDSLLGVGISSAARVRFERLRDMISLYALSECTDYLNQKESLIQMNFQLIAIKESVDVERLTRAAFLISKATVLFLPVSFMTSYFSAQFEGTVFTIKDYWIAFTVVLLLSWLVLVGFGAISGTLESWKYFPGLRYVVDCVRRARGKKKLGDGRFSMGLRSVRDPEKNN